MTETKARFTLDYIEDAATARRTIHLRDGGTLTDSASNYDPPRNGIHLCGQTDDGEQPTTVARYPMGWREAARLFDIAREVASCESGSESFIVDLCINGDVVDDFSTNRQLWPRAIAAWNEAT
jgi:hypothetical protein